MGGSKDAKCSRWGRPRDGEYLMARGRHRLEALKLLMSLGYYPRDFKVRCVVLTPRRDGGAAATWQLQASETKDEDWVAEYARWEECDNQLQRDLVLAHEVEAAELQRAMATKANAV